MNLEEKVDKILTNDLVHIHERLGCLEGQMDILTKLTVGILIGVVGSLILQVYKVL